MKNDCALPKKTYNEKHSTQITMLLFLAKCISYFVFINSFIIANGQVWERAHISVDDWKVIGNIQVDRSNGLNIHNTLPLIDRSEKNRLFTEVFPGIHLNTRSIGNYMDISFDVKNYTNVPLSNKDYWDRNMHGWVKFDKVACWQLEVEYVDSMDRVKFEKKWIIRSSGNLSHEYDHDWSVYDGGLKNNRTARVYFIPDFLEIYIDNAKLAHIENVKTLTSIRVRISPSEHLVISNISCKNLTIYGQALPYLTDANHYLKNNNPSLAAREITLALDKGIKCYDTYVLRGVAYYRQGYYKSAIEDFTNAISSSASNKETAYFYRGLSRMAIGDDYGIMDLKNGGQEGMVFLRENNLLNYTPGKKNQKAKNKKVSSPSRGGKKALKK